MKSLSSIQKSMISSMCIALCCVLPIAFHLFGAGSAFSPMHIPVFICGIICGWPYGLMCGLAGPILSCILTSMPSLTTLPAMIAELITYGVVCGFLSAHIHTKHTCLDLYISLIVAIISGRIIAGIVQAFLYTKGTYTLKLWVGTFLIESLPGTIIQLLFIPTILMALMNANLIPKRYYKNKK